MLHFYGGRYRGACLRIPEGFALSNLYFVYSWVSMVVSRHRIEKSDAKSFLFSFLWQAYEIYKRDILEKYWKTNLQVFFFFFPFPFCFGVRIAKWVAFCDDVSPPLVSIFSLEKAHVPMEMM